MESLLSEHFLWKYRQFFFLACFALIALIADFEQNIKGAVITGEVHVVNEGER